ncbi:acetolactate synthase-1/2/3 large subunit [Prauserella isguenensis]|uniref:Acetolactate synthase-1/2/3 large subunit n=1 Tax=Prauserella isguenensis TaxID=1470180 RepID=A0A839S934_9PSEU|nr:acetolactate synthase-1/2/3 large subunit [Prauserella isguenensis]
MHPRLAGHAVVEQLLAHDADVAFCVPGESYLAVLDGLYDARDRIDLITARQEGGAAMMAAAYGKLTGRPGVCLVTRGPGATNASIGVHTAHQDASPMVLLVGQVSTEHLGRRSFQEVDYQQMFGSLAKDVVRVDRADRVPELIARAFHTAVSGEPGPVVVALPEDVLGHTTDAPVVRPGGTVRPGVASSDVEAFVTDLGRAARPLVVAGGTGWDQPSTRRLRQFAEAFGVPVAAAFRNQDVMANTSDVYVGPLGLRTTDGLSAAVREADLVAFLGTRPDAASMDDHGLLAVPQPTQRVTHIHPDPDVIHHVYRADHAIVAGPAEFVMALPASPQDIPALQEDSALQAERTAWCGRLRENYLRSLATPSAGSPDSLAYMQVFNDRAPGDTIISTGAGAYTSWPQRHRRFTAYPSQAGTQSGAMGYGLPAAIAAKLAFPDRTVVAFAGDGCILMTGQELSTAVRYGLDIVVVVVNNSRYGTIRNHQEAAYPGRVVGTELVNPDFVALAGAFGAHGVRVHTPSEFRSALDACLDSGGTSLIEIVTE